MNGNSSSPSKLPYKDKVHPPKTGTNRSGGCRAFVCVLFCCFVSVLVGALVLGWSLPSLSVTKTGPYELCSDAIVYLKNVKTGYKDHVYTRRGFGEMQSVMPAFIDLSERYKAQIATGKKYRMLDQGCGSARGLLEAQHLFPGIQMFGTNFEGYGTGEGEAMWGQVDDKPASLIRMARHFNIPLMCNSIDHRVVLPTVLMTPSIAKYNFEYPFPFEFFDTIVSRDALNSMKLREYESHVYIPIMLRALRPGGVAALHIDYGANYMYPVLKRKLFSVCAMYTNIYFEGTKISIVIYKGEDTQHPQDNFYQSYFGIVFRRCPPGETHPTADCVIPPDFAYDKTHVNIFKTPMAFEERPLDRKEATDNRVVYAFDYMKNLIRVLDMWHRDGYIT